MPPKTRGVKRKPGNQDFQRPPVRIDTPSEPAATPEAGREETHTLEPIPPENFYFDSTNYAVSCKLASKCDDLSTVELLRDNLNDDEYKWFAEHPQFKHVFHMHKEKFTKLTHLWMLLVRTVMMKRGKMAWFVVNGVPIRYSLREHAILSGLSCKAFPENYEHTINSRFVKTHFGTDGSGKKKILVKDVLEKFKTMQPGTPRLKMAVLLFLSTVIKKSNSKGFIDPLFLKIVSNLDACVTFPWGRFTFEENLKEIWHTMDHFKGTVQPTWTFPGFINPLSILACESIPVLHKAFREDFEDNYGDVTSACPRMCRTKWKHCPMKGWPLVDINEVLGESKEIQSILEPTDTEVALLDQVLDEDDLYNGEDPLSCNWNSCNLEAKKKIIFEDVFKADVAGRSDNLNVVRSLSLKETLTKLIQDGLAEAYARIDKVSEVVELLHPRMENIELSVTELLQWRDGFNVEDDNGGGGDAANFMETPLQLAPDQRKKRTKKKKGKKKDKEKKKEPRKEGNKKRPRKVDSKKKFRLPLQQ